MAEISSSREFRPDLEREFQYLLGQMPRVDRETFQGLLIENAEVSERVLEAEDELFDAWVRGDLPRDWSPLFEERLLATPEGRRKATIARILASPEVPSMVGEKAQQRKGPWGQRLTLLLALLVLVIAGLGFWFWQQRDAVAGRGGDTGGRGVESEQQTPDVETLRLQVIGRGDAASRPKFRIAASTTTLRFAIPENATVAAELATLEGKTIWKGAANGSVPATLVPPGLYLLTTFEQPGIPSNFYEFEISGN